MIRRVAIASAFALLGFVSLLVVDSSYKWTCSHFPGFCRSYTGACPGIDTCTLGVGMTIVGIVVYLGPAIVFGTTGFFISRCSRSAFVWITLIAGLVAAHSAVMIAAIQATTK